MLDKSESFAIQRKLSLVLFSAGSIVSIINFFSIYSRNSFHQAINSKSVYVLLLISLAILFSAFWDNELIRLTQVLMLIATAVIAILDAYNSIHGLGLLIIAAVISFKYGYFESWFKTKAIISILFTIIITEYSAKQQDPSGNLMYGFDAAIYIVLFFVVIYLIYSDDINSYIEINKSRENTIGFLEKERDLLVYRIKSLDRKIASMTPDSQPVDLSGYGITAAELRVIEVLVVYRATDRDIAEKLNLSFHTVKNHFRSIRNKLGVDRREEIIDLCRFNFLDQP